MFKRSYRFGFEPAGELVVQSYLSRTREDKAEKWKKAPPTPKIKAPPTEYL
jgi:hypothetical protein